MISSFSTFAIIWAALLWHPVHETVCEVEWNPNNRRMEVALRIDVLDEQWIAEKVNAKDGAKSKSDWRIKYLRSQLFFDPKESGKKGTPPTGRPIHWIGRKQEGAHVWWFFEVVCDDGKPPTSIQTRLFFDRHRDYQHRIVVLGGNVLDNGKRPSFVLTNEKPAATLSVESGLTPADGRVLKE
ncbi:MAG: hypothetical protein KDB00_05335 [Planctomycetales bacterium]|nr:hypothetical protein [Planctomycetales bacterium]